MKKISRIDDKRCNEPKCKVIQLIQINNIFMRGSLKSFENELTGSTLQTKH